VEGVAHQCYRSGEEQTDTRARQLRKNEGGGGGVLIGAGGRGGLEAALAQAA
jgi:hypothetical protein